MRQSHSYSKRDLLESCARRYFYEYYAAAKKVPFDPDRKRIIHTLKELSGSYLLAGELLHWFIEQYLKKGPTPSLRSWLLRKVEERFDKSVDWSRRYSPFDEVEKEQYPTRRRKIPQMLPEKKCSKRFIFSWKTKPSQRFGVRSLLANIG